LASAYRESLKLAAGHNLASIAFPSISTGAYGYPVDQAAKVAINAVVDFLKGSATSIKEVVFVLHSNSDYKSYASALETAVKA
jgi:O-acetyl-ADP-ribose deacetylase (regulator of RNase III)